VIEMLETYMPKKMPHEDFPKENLVDVMRPYLVFYLYIEWISYRRKYNLRVLLQNLHIFYSANPQYGRKIITKTPNVFGQRAFTPSTGGQRAFTPSTGQNTFGLLTGTERPSEPTSQDALDLNSPLRVPNLLAEPENFVKININFITNAIRPPILYILPNSSR